MLTREPVAGAALDDRGPDAAVLPEPEERPGRARRGLPPWLRPGAPTWTWGGIAVAIAGFVLIAVGWGQAAGEVRVYRQVPYLVSAALVGMSLVVVGLTLVNVASRRRDGIQRDAQTAELVTVLGELRATLAEPERRR